MQSRRIVRASEKDVAQVYAIEQEAFSPPWSEESFFDELKRDDSFFIVAVAHECDSASCCVAFSRSGEPHFATQHDALSHILGYAIFRQVGDDGELLKIAVDKNARQRGVGNMLMEAVLEHAASKVLSSVFLEVRESNEAAVTLYKKYGFTTVRVRNNYYDNPIEDALIMSKA